MRFLSLFVGILGVAVNSYNAYIHFDEKDLFWAWTTAAIWAFAYALCGLREATE